MRPGTSLLTLRQARYLRALTQRELAARAGLTHVQVARIELGQVSPRPATRRALAHRFGRMAKAWRDLWQASIRTRGAVGMYGPDTLAGSGVGGRKWAHWDAVVTPIAAP